ncbi:MAG TPA: VWA domain-containing protein [Candidatus Sulfotelmatobacter sp.]
MRAQNEQSKRHPPYYRVTVLAFSFIFLVRNSEAQKIERYEGILIDTSGSISRGGQTNELFAEYLSATRQLLRTEPANSRVWVATISTDSFGGVHEVLKGWTPDARGVFTDDLNRARAQLALSFEEKSSFMSPMAAGTDIFGALWRLKAVIESDRTIDPSRPKTIWIFSDMVNETRDFLMPELVKLGPEQMLERAKTNRLVVPLKGYKIYIYGASPADLTPQIWITLEDFWGMYFVAAGAELISYSTDCDSARQK